MGKGEMTFLHACVGAEFDLVDYPVVAECDEAPNCHQG